MNPIDNMITQAVKCVKCGAGYGKCKCWTKCKCGWSYATGKRCTNSDCAYSINWHDLLKRMKHEYLKATKFEAWTISGGYDYKINPYSDKTANQLTRAIEDFLNYFPGGVAEGTRINSTGTPRQMPDGSIKWSKSNMKLGIADVKGTFKGRALNIEVKIGRDMQSEAQKKEQERIIKAGGIYWLANSFPHFLEQWLEAGFDIPVYEPIIKPAIV